MIRGAQKRLVVVKTEGSRLFDEAYFILRREIPEKTFRKEDLLNEAEKVLLKVSPGVRPKRKRGRLLFFFLGLLFGVLCFFLGLLAKNAWPPS